jgi:hypothetical protein
MRIPLAMLAALLTAAAASAQSAITCGVAPGWQPQGAARAYAADNLFEYKDGGAEGYLQYGFTALHGVTCAKDGTTLDIDVSAMAGADSAYGMFMANADQSQPMEKLGMGTQVLKQSVLAAKGKFYLELVETAAKTDADDTAFLRALAIKILAQLEGADAPPATIGWFVPDDLVQVKMVPESVLGLKQIPRGYAAKYKQGQAFIAEQASVGEAQALMKTLREKFTGAPTQLDDEAFTATAKYLTGICIFRKGKVVAGTANFPDADAALTQAKKLAARIP